MEGQSRWLGTRNDRSQFQCLLPKTPRDDWNVNSPYDSKMLSCREVMRKGKLISWENYFDRTPNSLVEFIEKCMPFGGENY